MGTWTILAVSVLYGITAFDYFLKKEYGLGFAFVGYIVANFGFILHNYLTHK